MFWPAAVFVAAMVIMAAYNFYSIRGMTSTKDWHYYQWTLVGMLLFAGWLYGKQPFSWHNFGEVAAVAVLGVPVYVFLLHYLLRRY
jgi:1,4-dihydroxy-2-naphthoate octaprenyltransferase